MNLGFLYVQGKVPEFGYGLPDTESKAGEDKEEYQSHDTHEIDEILIYFEKILLYGSQGNAVR